MADSHGRCVLLYTPRVFFHFCSRVALVALLWSSFGALENGIVGISFIIVKGQRTEQKLLFPQPRKYGYSDGLHVVGSTKGAYHAQKTAKSDPVIEQITRCFTQRLSRTSDPTVGLSITIKTMSPGHQHLLLLLLKCNLVLPGPCLPLIC